jgi:hypothetical protein
MSMKGGVFAGTGAVDKNDSMRLSREVPFSEARKSKESLALRES